MTKTSPSQKPSPYNRPKQPERIRRAILDEATRILRSEGLAGVTIQAVATAAGVTKGGVFHHFASKQALLGAMILDLMTRLDAAIDGRLADDHGPGCFTRAYVETLLVGEEFGIGSPFDALGTLFVTDPTLISATERWLADRLERHKETDGDPALEIVRYACDGAWVNYLGRKPGLELSALRDRLIAMTRAV